MSENREFRLNIGSLNRFRGRPPIDRRGVSKKGVFHSFLFGTEGREAAMGYIMRLKMELGDAGYETLIDRIVDEIHPDPEVPPIPAPVPAVNVKPAEQMQLPGLEASRRFHVLGFLKDVKLDHPGVAEAQTWKHLHRMTFMTFDKLKDELADGDAVYSAKMDGELVCVWYEDGKTVVVTNRGTIRSGMPATDEVSERLAGHKKVVLMGELYAADAAGRPISYMQAASILKDPDAGKDSQIRLAIFDLIELDGKRFDDVSILEKMDTVQKLFTGTKSVHPAYTTEGTVKDIEDLWNELEKRGLEGIVVHRPDGSLWKSKPILSLDMVIVAVTKSHSTPDRIGAILAATMDKEGRYRLNGHIGTGLTDDQRIDFLDWAKKHKVSEDEEYIWVDPTQSPVIEVEAVEINEKKMPALIYKDGAYVEIEKQMSGTLRFPVLKHTRPDKDPKYPDVGIEQLPFKTSSNDKPYVPAAGDLRVGQKIRTITGHTGVIAGLMPSSGDGGSDMDILVTWDQPLYGLYQTEIHPTELAEVTEEVAV